MRGWSLYGYWNPFSTSASSCVCQARHRIDKTRQQVSEGASTVHALSHQLHPSKLNFLGVGAACAGFCREFSERHDVKVDVQSCDIPKALPPEISIGLFRILQEAVQNAFKHSGVRHYQVSLISVSNVIRLSVHDAGFGFDLQETVCGEGFGLTSMRERLKLVDGELTIESNRQHGTTVTACIPFHVGTPERFARGKQIGTYVGMIPIEDSSGDRQRLGHISKQGSSLLRYLLVEAAQAATRFNPHWRRRYIHLAMRRHKSIAKVAMGRRMAIRLYWMWRNGCEYSPSFEFGSYVGQLGTRHGGK